MSNGLLDFETLLIDFPGRLVGVVLMQYQAVDFTLIIENERDLGINHLEEEPCF